MPRIARAVTQRIEIAGSLVKAILAHHPCLTVVTFSAGCPGAVTRSRESRLIYPSALSVGSVPV